MAEPFFVPFDAFWIVLAGLLVASARVLARLRTIHPELWVELGRPRMLPRSTTASAGLTRFYWSRRPAALGDPDLQRWVRAMRVLHLLMAGVLAVLWSSFASAL